MRELNIILISLDSDYLLDFGEDPMTLGPLMVSSMVHLEVHLHTMICNLSTCPMKF